MRTLIALLLFVPVAAADGERDNQVDNVRKVPPPGVAVPDADKTELDAGLAELGKEIEGLKAELKAKPALLALLPDVQIYHNAVRYALQYGEFFNVKEIPVAKKHLKTGKERAGQLREGKPAWNTATGPIARGYVSKIDGSVQPYGVFVPQTFVPGADHRHRVDTWFHGRGETLSEVNFIAGVERGGGPFTPADSLVVQLYGRYCCANKLAGEVDLFEALDDVRKHYPVDEDRIAVRGFSMGGAAAWHFAVHFPGHWAAAAPGAGFSETPDFLKVWQRDPVKPTAWEQTLWHMYDCTDYAVNLFNLPTVAYSGEIDGQKQAADLMEKAMKAEGLDLVHIIGPKTAHAYEPEAKKEVAKRIDEIVAKGRNRVPTKIRFTTWLLRYNQSHWITVNAMNREWARARVEAEITDDHTLSVKVENVDSFTISMPAGLCPLDPSKTPIIKVNGLSTYDIPPVAKDKSWTVHLEEGNRAWIAKPEPRLHGKRHGLQGPIDDAFMDSFVMVRPTGTAKNAEVDAWSKKEMAHAIEHWRLQFRGDARQIDDDKVGDAEIAAHNLILWGDAKSNKVIAKISDRLPALAITAETQAPILIYPNPLNPKKYVVLNSGFTFREYDYLNNARQVPRLPDWAVVDVTTPPNSRWPGKIVDAGFFDEGWRLK